MGHTVECVCKKCFHAIYFALTFYKKYHITHDTFKSSFPCITVTFLWARWRLKSPAPTIVYSILYSGADQRKHQSSASLAFMRVIHRGPVNSPHKWPVTRKMFPFDDVIMCRLSFNQISCWNGMSSKTNDLSQDKYTWPPQNDSHCLHCMVCVVLVGGSDYYISARSFLRWGYFCFAKV